MLLILFIIATATFFLLEAIPGNPLMQKVERLPENVKEAMYENMDIISLLVRDI